MNGTVRNMVRAAVVGIAIWMILGGLLAMFGVNLPDYIGIMGVGIVSVIAFLLLNGRKE